MTKVANKLFIIDECVFVRFKNLNRDEQLLLIYCDYLN